MAEAKKKYAILTLKDGKFEIYIHVVDLETGFEVLKELYKKDHSSAKPFPLRYVGIYKNGKLVDKYFTEDGFSLIRADAGQETYQHAYWRREVSYYINNMEDLSKDERILKMTDAEVDDLASEVADDILENSDYTWEKINDRIDELVRIKLALN